MNIFTYNYKIKYLDLNYKKEFTLSSLTSLLQDSALYHAETVGYGINNMEKANLFWVILNWKIQMLFKPNFRRNFNC